MFVVRGLMSVVCCPLLVVGSLWFVVCRCLLCLACCVLSFDVCCVCLFVCCVLIAVCCLSCVGC